MEPVTAIVVLPDEHKEPNGEVREVRFHAFVAMRDAREAKSDRGAWSSSIEPKREKGANLTDGPLWVVSPCAG